MQGPVTEEVCIPGSGMGAAKLLPWELQSASQCQARVALGFVSLCALSYWVHPLAKPKCAKASEEPKRGYFLGLRMLKHFSM